MGYEPLPYPDVTRRPPEVFLLMGNVAVPRKTARGLRCAPKNGDPQRKAAGHKAPRYPRRQAGPSPVNGARVPRKRSGAGGVNPPASKRAARPRCFFLRGGTTEVVP
jgi:hypothetical protein